MMTQEELTALLAKNPPLQSGGLNVADELAKYHLVERPEFFEQEEIEIDEYTPIDKETENRNLAELLEFFEQKGIEFRAERKAAKLAKLGVVYSKKEDF